MYNQIKHYGVFLTALLLVMLFLVACGGNEPATDPTEAPAATEAPAEEAAADGMLPEVDVLAVSDDIVKKIANPSYRPPTSSLAKTITCWCKVSKAALTRLASSGTLTTKRMPIFSKF